MRRQWSTRLFQFSGIDVYLHWSWFVLAVYEVLERRGDYSSVLWNGLEYLALFGIVLAHEFGHALACRQSGGRADRILLWPLGGVAFVQPPPRPGATLWSVAAGPLVNVALIPVLGALILLNSASGFAAAAPNLALWLNNMMMINIAMLIFNLLPLYPLDGGQILRSLLWLVIGRAQSLMISSSIGFLGVGGLALLAFVSHSPWLGVLALFAATQCLMGFRHARALRLLPEAQRRADYVCPSCTTGAAKGPFWLCPCGSPFDPFNRGTASRPVGTTLALRPPPAEPAPMDPFRPAACPRCDRRPVEAACLDCGANHPFAKWSLATPVASLAPPVAFNAPLPKRASAERSTVPLVFGVCSMVLAVASFLAMLVFLVLLNVSNLPNRSVLEGIWRTPGFSLPIRQPVFLQRAGLNWIYLDTLESDLTKDDTIDIVLTDPRGRQVLVNPLSLEGFHKGNRELLPKGAFFVPAPGAYVLQIGPGAPGASIKIGPPTQVGSSVLARFNEGLAIAAGGFMIVFGTTGFFLLRRGYSGPRSRDKRALTARA